MKQAIALFCVLTFGSLAFAVQSVRVKSEGTTLYRDTEGVQDKATLKRGEILVLLKTGGNRSFVRTRRGLKGWITNAHIEYISEGQGDVYELDVQDITGWLDNPTAVYILDHSGTHTDPILLTRSFHDEIFEFIDRETVERANEEN